MEEFHLFLIEHMDNSISLVYNKKIDTLEGCVVFTDGTKLPIEDIEGIEFSCWSDG